MKKVKAAKQSTKFKSSQVMKQLAFVPKPIDISKDTSSRSQYSIKCKRKLAKFVVTRNLPVTISATMAGVSSAQLYAWKKDYKAGVFHLKNAVCVSRS